MLIYIHIYFLSLGYYSCDKTSWPRQLDEERGYLAYMSFCSSRLKVVRARAQTGQEAGGRNWHRSHGGVLLIGLLPMTCSVWFCTETRTISPKLNPPTMDWVVTRQSLILKMLYNTIIWRHFFFSWGSLLSVIGSLCQVEINRANALCLYDNRISNW